MSQDPDLDSLATLCKVMKGLIERFGKLPSPNIPFDCEALVGTIANQQLSGKAAQTLLGRLRVVCSPKNSERLPVTDSVILFDVQLGRNAALNGL